MSGKDKNINNSPRPKEVKTKEIKINPISPKSSPLSLEICPVCADNVHPKFLITCSKCQYICCRWCIQQYLRTKNNVDPTCMNCNVLWDLEFLAENIDPKFYNFEYRDIRASRIIEREKSLLPSTQPAVEKEIKLRSIKDDIRNVIQEARMYRKLVSECNDKLNKLQRTLYAMENAGDNPANNPANNPDNNPANNVGDNNIPPSSVLSAPIKKLDTRFLGHCPVDNCKGFIVENKNDNPELPTIYNCGICKAQVCKRCRELKHPGVKCNKDTVNTVKLLKKDTKKCPGCGIPTFKISGCPQMWCVSCKTPWSWETGIIENGRIHNPHYYAWIKDNVGYIRREPGDEPCGGYISIAELHHRLMNVVRCPPKKYDYFSRLHRFLGDMRDTILPLYEVPPFTDQLYLKYRIKYMMNEIDIDEWKYNIKKQEKKREKTIAIRLVLEMFVNVADDLLRNIFNANSITDVDNIKSQISTLLEYTNNNLNKIGSRFQNKVPIIKVWRFIDVGRDRGYRRGGGYKRDRVDYEYEENSGYEDAADEEVEVIEPPLKKTYI